MIELKFPDTPEFRKAAIEFLSQVEETTEEPEVLEVDSHGNPWDSRIHSSGKTLYKSGDRKGTWVLKRGASADLVAEVLNGETEAPDAEIPQPPIAAPTPPIAPAPPVATTEEVMAVYVAGMQASEDMQGYMASVDAICKDKSISSIAVIENHPEIRNELLEALKELK